jgi:hypothetical protein
MNISSSERALCIERTNGPRGTNRASGSVFDESMKALNPTDARQGSRPYVDV